MFVNSKRISGGFKFLFKFFVFGFFFLGCFSIFFINNFFIKIINIFIIVIFTVFFFNKFFKKVDFSVFSFDLFLFNILFSTFGFLASYFQLLKFFPISFSYSGIHIYIWFVFTFFILFFSIKDSLFRFVFFIFGCFVIGSFFLLIISRDGFAFYNLENGFVGGPPMPDFYSHPESNYWTTSIHALSTYYSFYFRRSFFFSPTSRYKIYVYGTSDPNYFAFNLVPSNTIVFIQIIYTLTFFFGLVIFYFFNKYIFRVYIHSSFEIFFSNFKSFRSFFVKYVYIICFVIFFFFFFFYNWIVY